MATPILPHSGAEPSQLFTQFAAIYSGPLPELPASEENIPLPAAGLACVRGVLMALGIEFAAAVAVLCLYGAWRL
jgi:hypothetical protein